MAFTINSKHDWKPMGLCSSAHNNREETHWFFLFIQCLISAMDFIEHYTHQNYSLVLKKQQDNSKVVATVNRLLSIL